METKVFYHGGVPADFNIDNIDIYRLATKQGKQDRNYAGFYMFDESRRDGAFHYAEQTNSVENTTDRGVVRIEMDSNLNIKALDRMFEIDRIPQEQLQEYRNQGYDLVSGRSFDGQQYVLLNKDKIRNISFESMDKRYSEEPKQEVEVKEEQTQDEYMTLEELESILSESGYMCLGHGTGRKGNDDEIVDSIFSEGLRTKNNSLALTTIGLSTPTPELKQQYAEYGIPEPTMDGLKEQLNNWQHLDSQKIILARVPTEYINQMGDRSDLDGEMYGAFMVEEIQANGKTTNYLDPRYIIGCYDVEKKAVRMNPCFERTLTNQTISTLQSKYKKALDKTKQRLAKAKQEMFSPIQEQQIQEARFNEIQSKLPLINEKLNHIRELPKSSNVYETRKEELLRERLYFYHRKNNITQEDMDRLNNYIATLDSIEQEIVNLNQQTQQVEQPTIQEQQPNLQEQEQINQLKGQIQQYDNQIAMQLANIQPYMQIPKVNQEISKVVAKNDEINSSQIIDSLQDYKSVVEIKQTLVAYLEQANKFIKDNVEKQQHQPVQPQPVQQEQTTQSLSEDFWKEFEQPQEEQKPQQPLPDNFWDEFDNPNNIQNTRPERVYNDDGTYTMEYIAHLSNTPLGFNQQIYDQLMQQNAMKRQQADAMIQAMVNGQLDTNGQPIVPEEEQMTSGRHMGFINVKILGAIATIVSLVAILGIVLLNLK